MAPHFVIFISPLCLFLWGIKFVVNVQLFLPRRNSFSLAFFPQHSIGYLRGDRGGRNGIPLFMEACDGSTPAQIYLVLDLTAYLLG